MKSDLFTDLVTIHEFLLRRMRNNYATLGSKLVSNNLKVVNPQRCFCHIEGQAAWLDTLKNS